MTRLLCCIGDLVDHGDVEVKTGPFGTQLRARDYVEDGIPVINVRNIGLGSIKPEKLEYISERTTDRLSAHLLKPKDIVFGRKGAVERHAYIHPSQEGWLQGSDCLRLRILSENLVLSRFLSYAFLTQQHQSWMMQQCSHGATMASLNQDIIRRIPIELPPITVQKKITAILSAYDDLIENNTRRIAILEEMARRLYEEWFVKFCFPEHNKTDFVRDLPSGWLRQTVNGVSSYINRGLAPKYDENADCRVINQKCIRDQHLSMEPARRQAKAVPPEKLIRFGDVLINSTGVGTLGRVAQVYETLEKVTADSHVTIVRPDIRVDIDYFGHTLLRLQPFFEGQGVGSTGQTELSRNRIGEAELITPPIDLQKKFGQIVRPMRLLCVRLAAQNANLRAQRDLLLPKLISGEIDVSEAQETLKEAVA